jgi:peroxiredoxin
VFIQSAGLVKDKSDDKAINAQVSLYFFDTISKNWVLWGAESYGQINPVSTSESGSYGFMVPAGKYYLEAAATGYHKTQSQIFSLTQTTALNFNFNVRAKPTIAFTLPIIGRVVLTIPEVLLPPDNVDIEAAMQALPVATESLVGQETPSLSLPGLDGKALNISEYKGKKLLLTFMSPLFPQSLEQASVLADLFPELPEDTSMLAVSLQQTMGTTRVFMERSLYNFPIAYDKNGESAAVFNINYLPKSFLINEDGIVSEVYTGVFSKTEILNKFNNMQ